MRLNMWMIKNQLEGLELHCSIPEISEQRLISSRLVYAPNCVWITPQEEGSACVYEDEKIVMPELSQKYAFELIQGIFDYYNDWYTATVSQAKEERCGKCIYRRAK